MRVVAKVGTSSITDARGVINTDIIDSLCGQIAVLRTQGHHVVLVSSGAVSAGVSALGFASRPTDLLTLRALSAAGQGRLMECYNRALDRHQLVAAQALLVANDFVDRRQYLHTRRTFDRLIELGCVTIVNENDAIAGDEHRYGDNDRIAALLANSISADVLVLLTDTPGVFSADPRLDTNATLIQTVAADDPLLSVRAGVSGSNRGSGGMASKVSAAQLASWSGLRAVIAQADRPNVLVDAVNDVQVGTTFLPSDRRLPARKLWIGFACSVSGSVTVDAGARVSLIERGTSLLPAGVIAVTGTFDEGDVIEVRDVADTTIARGMVLSSADTLRTVMGKRTVDVPSQVAHEVIHRDDLVMLL